MKRLLLFCVLIASSMLAQAKVNVHAIKSPNGTLELQVVADHRISFTLLYNGQTLISRSEISMTLDNGTVWGVGSKLAQAKNSSQKETIDSPLYRKKEIVTAYNQIDLSFKDGFGLQFRLYDQGAAYRFYTKAKNGFDVMAEEANFFFPEDFTSYIPYSSSDDKSFGNSFESIYSVLNMSQMEKGALAFTPLLVCAANGVKVTLTESDLESYPGMFLRKTSEAGRFGFEGVFAPIPNKVVAEPYRCEEMVASYSNVLAHISGARTFPWRVMAVAQKDTELPVNDLVYALASPSRLENTRWIKPGKVAWDWWNNWGITGVDFPAGINTQTYKYFIDFAAANGIEYVVLDEGWSPHSGGDIMAVVPEIDLQELVSYAKEKDVDLILWCVAYVLDKKLEEACRTYSQMGFKGFKVDFMNRDDQPVVDLNYRIAATAAKYQMLVDFHGMYKPAGMNRTYPNVINFEGVFGLEQAKWSTEDLVSYDVTFPYIRMMSGPVDYTPGGMRNATLNDFAPVYNNPMAAGTRAHQVAMYVVLDNPLVMLADNPTAYMKEQETTSYIVTIPTVWDQTHIVDGQLGEYIVSARKSGNKWFAGGLNNWTGRDITLDLSFLDSGKTYTARIFKDGVNAARHATDYAIETVKVSSKDKLTIHLAPGGGFAIQF